MNLFNFISFLKQTRLVSALVLGVLRGDVSLPIQIHVIMFLSPCFLSLVGSECCFLRNFFPLIFFEFLFFIISHFTEIPFTTQILLTII